MNALVHPVLTLEAYLAWEEGQPERFEFHRGEVFAMVGGRRSHGRVVSNLVLEIGGLLKGSPCQVFAESIKLQIADDTVLYPDLFVTGDRQDLATERIFRAPTLVVEVLSPSTQSYDRSHKFALYRRGGAGTQGVPAGRPRHAASGGLPPLGGWPLLPARHVRRHRAAGRQPGPGSAVERCVCRCRAAARRRPGRGRTPTPART